jgi:ATP/maltotriose-dependent transcriptional regulator MalT
MRPADAFYEAGLPLARTMTDPWIKWLGPQNFGLHARARGDLATAIRFYSEALTIARTTDDRIDEAISLGALQETTLLRGDYGKAQQLAEEARGAAQVAGDEWAKSFAVLQLGRLAVLRGDHATAKLYLEQSLEMVRRQGDPFRMALALEGLGQVALAEAEHDKAYAHLAESIRLLDEFGSQKDIADCLESFAALGAAESIIEEPLQLAGAAAAIRAAIGSVQAPLRRDLLERWLSIVRSRVAEDVFARNWTTGRELTIQQAIALALNVRPSGASNSATLPHRPEVGLAGMTAREVEVLQLVARGQSNKEIASELVLSVRTVERHITNLYGKIDARGKADATAYAIRHGLV